MNTVYSFDVFDTCLTRNFAAPSDLFLELGHRILLKMPDLLQRFDAEALWAARMEAEQCARRASPHEEVTLSEIWRVFAQRVGWEGLTLHLSLELELENNCLRPIPTTLREIEILRMAGYRILFISDIYLPLSFVKCQLQKHGFTREGDGIFLSSDWRTTKATGNLFRKVLAAENLEPRALIHCGDNAKSDVAVPRKLGIGARLVSHRPTSSADRCLLKADGIDYALRSKFVGAMQTSRVVLEPESSPAAVSAIASVVNPLVFAFASWTLAQAQRDGVRRLYFLARDCQMTYHAAKELSKEFGDIECRYLHVSRQSLLLPTATEISEAGMPWLRRNYETPALERLLAKLELGYTDVQAGWDARAGSQRGKYVLTNDRDWNHFWKVLNREPLGSALLARIEERRLAAKTYFHKEGLTDPIPWAIVDLGWYLSCQSALHALLGRDGSVECCGYYLGLRRERLAPGVTGKATALFHQRGRDLPDGVSKQFLFQHATLFEHVLGLADHHSVHRYERSGSQARPVFQGAEAEPANIGLTRAIHAGVRRFAAQNATLAPEIGAAAVARAIISGLGGTFAEHPSPEVSRALAAVEASTDQNNLRSSPLGAPLQVCELAAAWFPKRLRKFIGCAVAGPSVWIEGRLAASSPSLRWLYGLRQSVGRWSRSPNSAT